MALLTLGAIVTEARGSIGGTVFSRNKGGAYARARVVPINRNTPAQSLVRANFGSNSKVWTGLMSASERAAWTAFAAANQLTNILGAPITVSGMAMSMKLNQVLAQVGVGPILDPPPDLSVPALAAATAVVFDGTDETLKVTTAAQAVTAGAKYYIFATGPLAAGRTPQTSQYRFIGAYAATAAATDIDLTAKWTALFGATWNTGAAIGVAVATVNTESGAVTPGLIFTTAST